MTIVHVDYEDFLDDEDKTRLILSTNIKFNRNVSNKEELFEYLHRWKPLSANIITVKDEYGDVILTRESWDDFFKGQEYTL